MADSYYVQHYDQNKTTETFSYILADQKVSVVDHSSRQPPFGLKISFTPAPNSMVKPTYRQLGLEPRVIYAQDDFRGNGEVTDGFQVTDSDTVIFLVGPSYGGVPVSQWRLDVIEHLAPYLPADTVLVVPQYKNIAFVDGPGGKETQIEWENQWLERADIIAMNLSVHWKNPDGSPGNIGPTTRFETGYYFAKSDQKELIVFVPTDPKPDALDWIEFHAYNRGIPVHHEYPEFYQAILDRAHSQK